MSFYLFKANNLWGGITLRNNGAYVAKLEITFKVDGKYQSIQSVGFPGYFNSYNNNNNYDNL